MKTLVMLKRQWFRDSGSDKIESRGSKCQHLDKHNNKERNDLDNEERNSLDEDKGEIEDDKYVPPPFVPLLPLL